ncbi:unnamed protein product [Urochloa humidicola]
MDMDLEKGGSPSPDIGGADGRRDPQCSCGSGAVNSCDRHYSFGLPNTSVGGMALLTLLFLALAAALLRRTHPAPPQAVSVVWTVSLLVCSYLGCWAYTLSRTMGAAAVFLRVTYPAALACAAGAVAGPVSGMAAAHLCTAWAAGMLGYALAEHRLHVGGEAASGEAAARTPSAPLREGQKLTAVHALFTASLMTLCLGARAAWLLFFPGRYGAERPSLFLVELAALVWLDLYLWAMLVACFLLREALVSMRSMMRAYFCCGASGALGALGVMVSDWVWVYWTGMEMMAMAAFFGYMLAVNTRCKDILAREGRQQLCLADLGDYDRAAEATPGTDVGGANAWGAS